MKQYEFGAEVSPHTGREAETGASCGPRLLDIVLRNDIDPTARVVPTGDNPRVIIQQAACRFEVEAYAVNSVEAEGRMGVLACASALPALGPLPGAGAGGNHHFTIIYRGKTGGV